MKALLALEDGRIFSCKSFTGCGESGGEIVFNTSMMGYQEILTDPSYCDQVIVMTYPLIGSYGVNCDDVESHFIHASAFLVKEYQSYPSNFRSRATLADFLNYYGIIGLEDLDTRALTKHIREFGSMRAYISTDDLNSESLVGKAKCVSKIITLDSIAKVTTKWSYRFSSAGIEKLDTDLVHDNIVWKFYKEKSSVVVLDYGLKLSILWNLVIHNFEVIVLPANTSVETIKRLAPKGIILSNGPGDPSSALYAIAIVKKLINLGFPIFGICLGHQILALALGARTYKLKFGHRGGNQPVQNLITGKVEITSQNHGFAIDIESISGTNIDITHLNLNDKTIEGIKHKYLPVFSVQYHPEASPGPKDSTYLFEYFKSILETC